MKKLIVSIKSSSETLSGFKKALKDARKGSLKGDHFELSFDHKKDFDRCVRNLGILSAILVHKPKSVYELAKLVAAGASPTCASPATTSTRSRGYSEKTQRFT